MSKTFNKKKKEDRVFKIKPKTSQAKWSESLLYLLNSRSGAVCLD